MTRPRGRRRGGLLLAAGALALASPPAQAAPIGPTTDALPVVPLEAGLDEDWAAKLVTGALRDVVLRPDEYTVMDGVLPFASLRLQAKCAVNDPRRAVDDAADLSVDVRCLKRIGQRLGKKHFLWGPRLPFRQSRRLAPRRSALLARGRARPLADVALSPAGGRARGRALGRFSSDLALVAYRQGAPPGQDVCDAAEAGLAPSWPGAASRGRVETLCSGASTLGVLRAVFYGVGAVGVGAGAVRWRPRATGRGNGRRRRPWSRGSSCPAAARGAAA